MLEERDFINRIRENIEPADFQDERAARIVSIMFDLMQQGKNIDPAVLINHLNGEDISQVVCASMFMPDSLSLEGKERVIDDCIKRMKSDKIKRKKQHLHEQIKTAQHSGDEEELEKLMQEFHQLIKKGSR